MKGIVRYSVDPCQMEIRDIPEPTLDDSSSHAIVQVGYTGICGRDLEHYHTTLSPNKVPYVPGHEFSGTVVDLPTNSNTKFSVGDRVVCETVAYVCGNCPACSRGTYNLCKKRRNIGGGMSGAFAPYIKVPLEYMHNLPDNVTLEEGALIEPLCVTYNATKINSTIKTGDTVVIIGAGTMALMSLTMAVSEGASVVLIGHPSDGMRLDLASKLGANHVLTSTDPTVDLVLSMTDGFGAPLVLDTVGGVGQTMANALAMVAPGGQITKIGWFIHPLDFNLDLLIRKNIRLQGSFSHNYNIWEDCISLLSDKTINVEDIISRVMALEEWRDAFTLLEQREALKILLNPNA